MIFLSKEFLSEAGVSGLELLLLQGSRWESDLIHRQVYSGSYVEVSRS